MILSRRTLKRMENLENVCSFDTDREVATLNMHFNDITEIIDEKMCNGNRLVVNQEALNVLFEGLELVPVEFKVNYKIVIDNRRNYDSKTVEQAFIQAMKGRDYTFDILKTKKHSLMSIFVVLGLVLLLVSIYITGNDMLKWVGLPFSAIIAFALELMFEVYFEKGVSYFVVSKIYEKAGTGNRFGTIYVE